jgi:hypothetical protein
MLLLELTHAPSYSHAVVACIQRDKTSSLMQTCLLKEDTTPESTSEEDRCA